MSSLVELQLQLVTGFTRKDLKTPEHRETNPYDLALALAQQNLDVAQSILGPNHPLTRFIKRGTTAEKTKQYVDGTKLLLGDTLARWKNVVEIGIGEQDIVLKRLIDFDCSRFGYLSIVEAVIHTLISGEWEENGKVKVPYQVINRPGEKGVYVFEKVFAADCLGYHSNGNSQSYKAYRDDRVPWLYMYAAELGDLEKHVSQVFDILSALYHGETIEVSDDAKKLFPPLALSEETRDELSRCGCLVLHPIKNPHVSIKIGNRPGVILVPIYHIPWIKEDGWPTSSFREWTLSQFEHEATHLRDSGVYNSSPNSVVLTEARAFLRQIDFHRKNKQDGKVESTMEYLNPYLGVLSGNKQPTHAEKYYIKNINAALTQLSPELLELVARTLTKV